MKPTALLLVALTLLMFLAFSACDDDDDDNDAVGDDDSSPADDDDNDDVSPVDDDLTDDDDNNDDDSSPVDDDDDDATPDDDDDDDDDDNDDATPGDDDDDDDDDTTPLDCPAVITRQPYLQLVTQTSMNVLWRTDQEADSFIEWGSTPDLGHYVKSSDLVEKHDLKIRHLSPGTTYYYKVRSCLSETDVATFRTAPDAETPFNFVAFSDNQYGWEIFTEVAALMETENPWLAISSGDCVNDGWVPATFEEQLFGPAASLWRSTPLYVAIGNHEANSIFFFESFHFPHEPQNYYAFTFGNVYFIGLAQDTAHWTIPGSPQYKFLVESLSSEEAQAADFRVLFFHTPPWTEGWPDYEGEWLVRMFIVPLMEQYGVDVYFNGHTHDFERGYRNGVTSYIIGGAGGDLDEWARDVEHIVYYNNTVHFYVSVQVTSDTMTINGVDLQGNIFDTWEIPKRK